MKAAIQQTNDLKNYIDKSKVNLKRKWRSAQNMPGWSFGAKINNMPQYRPPPHRAPAGAPVAAKTPAAHPLQGCQNTAPAATAAKRNTAQRQ